MAWLASKNCYAVARLGRFLAAALASLMFAMAPAKAQSTEPPVIAAASDLQFALADIAKAFRADTGQPVELSFGSSGNFARQIRQGAPFEIYLSADESYVLGLAEDGFTRDGGTLYAVGRIVIIVPHGSPLKADGSLDDLKAAVADGRLVKFAIANPDHAPYGKRAQEALRHQGLWDAIRPKLVLGENVSQAAQFAMSLNAEGGIIASSLALSPKVSALGAFALVPEDWHSPLRQRMVLLKNAGPVAERFYAYVQQRAARTIFRRYGFNLPDEAS
jgi:molybdate transport system substrate-binding protein